MAAIFKMATPKQVVRPNFFLLHRLFIIGEGPRSKQNFVSDCRGEGDAR